MLKSMRNLSEATPVLSDALHQIDQGEQLAQLEEMHKKNVKAILALQRALEESQGHTVAMLRKWAREINGWADESQQYGWSTHQVERNRKLAGEIHRQADLVETEREHLLYSIQEEAKPWNASLKMHIEEAKPVGTFYTPVPNRMR